MRFRSMMLMRSGVHFRLIDPWFHRHIDSINVDDDNDALVEMFKIVDLNADHVMTWHEFTTFLAELVSTSESSRIDALLHFVVPFDEI
jgi:Ca2+-binding EF-hand superfamily protein